MIVPTTSFDHGVCSGDPLPDGFVLWTRLDGVAGGSPAPQDITWQVATDPSFGTIVDQGTVAASAAADFTVRVDVRGLRSGTTYHYRFRSSDATSPAGRAKTMPEGHVDHLTFAITSCAFYRGGYYNVYGRIAERLDLDFVIHLGDYIYEFPNKLRNYAPWNIVEERVMDPDGECFTLDDYRRRYALTRRDPDVQAMHRAHTLIHMWEDHEIVNDAWQSGCPYELTMDWWDRKAAALRAYWEWMPVRWPDTGVSDAFESAGASRQPHIYRQFDVGDLISLFVIDTRHEGRDALPETFTVDAYADPTRRMMSEAQEQWLVGGLAQTTSRWRMIANGTMLAKLALRDIPPAIQAGVSKLNTALGDGTYGNPGQWEGFAANRSRLLDALGGLDVHNVVVLTGDIHSAWACELTDGQRDPVGVEFVTSSVSTRTLGDQVPVRPTDARTLEQLIRDQLPWVKYVELDHHGYVAVDVAPGEVTGQWWTVPTVRERTTEQSPVVRFRVPHGAARLEEVQP